MEIDILSDEALDRAERPAYGCICRHCHDDELGDEALDRPGTALGCAGPMCVAYCISQKV